MIISGFIFDAYLVSHGISLWILDEQGQIHALLDPWMPKLYAQEDPRLDQALRSAKIAIDYSPAEREDFFTHRPRRVIEIRVHNPLEYNDWVNRLQEIENLELFNCDIHPVQSYHYERQHFPLARGEFEVDPQGVLKSWRLRDSPWDLDYEWPPLRFAYLSLDHADDPNHSRKGALRITLGANPGQDPTYELEETDPRELISTVNSQIASWDPDVILSEWGDSFILPRLRLISAQTGIPLKLSRDPNRGIAGRASRSFYTYGRTIYQGGAQYLFGRWHLDMLNSFTLGQTGLDGLFEIARIAKLPVQRAARCTIGTSLSSMQLDVASRDGILIPLHKQQTEDFRDGVSLLVADKGGLVYAPELGWHEDVAELDFVSMYPAIMVNYNVSPETVNCECCGPAEAVPVPEAGHSICSKRRGLVPRVLEKILYKRGEYKRLSKTLSDPKAREVYKRRYTAHKWALVTCFGYLGFKNARFGKIEAHECVSAYGREVLLRAKELAEAEGFHMLHAIVDSMWVKKPGASPADYQALAERISLSIGFPLSVEGIYKWLRFCPSKTDDQIGVPNRYFGCFENGELKLRGIERRRSDTPPLFGRFQDELLDVLTHAHNVAECRSAADALEQIYESYRDKIKTGQVTLDQLAFSSTLSKEPKEYVHDTYSSIAARQLADAGLTLHAGESIQYVITAAKDKVKDWRVMPLVLAVNYGEYDPEKYLELLARAYKTIVEGLVDYDPAPARRLIRKSRPKERILRVSNQMVFGF